IRCFVTKMSGLRPFFSRHSLFCYEDVRAPPLFSLPVVLLGRCQGSAPFLVACCFVTKMSGLCPFSCCLLFCYEDVWASPLFLFPVVLLVRCQGSALFLWHSLLCYEDVRAPPFFSRHSLFCYEDVSALPLMYSLFEDLGALAL